MKIKLNTIFKVEVQRQEKSSWPLIKRPRTFLHLVLEHKRRYNSRKENVHQSNKVVEAMGKATVYCIMYTERCVAQVSTAGECKIYIEDFMPYGLVLKESNDFDTRINNVISFHSWCASRLILRDRTLCKGNPQQHWRIPECYGSGACTDCAFVPLPVSAGCVLGKRRK